MSAPAAWGIDILNAGGSSVIATLNHPTFTAPPVDKLCDIGTFRFKLGVHDSQVAACDPKLGREVRVYRGADWAHATYLWAGRIWGATGTFPDMAVEFVCYSLLDYATDRFIDRGA